MDGTAQISLAPAFAAGVVSFNPERLSAGRSARSLALGGLFALGWSPCIGPVLGAIPIMGAFSQSAPVAALLLIA